MRKLALFVLILFAISCAENYVVINSIDGRDVLSGIFYANAKGYSVKFMPPNGDSALIASKVGYGHDILLIQSDDRPISIFLQNELEQRNNTVELYLSPDGGETNLALAVRSGATKFIIVDAAFSDGALSVMPYAKLGKYYVILANADNIDEVTDIVENADEIIIYGYVDSAVRGELEGLNPQVIGKGEDRYEDNVELAGKMMDEYEISSIIMTEGTYIESGMIDSNLPLVFSGRMVPDVTYGFVKEKVKNDELSTVYLIGGTKITNAIRNMRNQIKEELGKEGIDGSFGIWLRFAQVIPGETGMVTLDSFPLPAYIPKLEITEAVYNTATGSLMVAVDNSGDGPAYYLTEIHILVDGVEQKVLGDDTVSLIEKGDTVGTGYLIDFTELEEGNVTAVVIVKYGSSKYTLEEYDEYVGGLIEIEYIDKSNVTAREARYDTSRKILYLSLKNNKEDVAYVSSDVTLVLDGEPTTVKGPYNEPLDGKSIIVVEFPIELDNEDLAANNEVTVHLKYGGRPGFLVRESTVVLPLQKEGFDFLLLLLILLIILLILLAIYLYLKNKSAKRGKK